MNIVTAIDSTQQQIIKQLSITENMIECIGRRLGDSYCQCAITTLEDLGLSNNVMRMQGGFFTGMHIKWNSTVNFIPVDATVNACGVSVYKLSNNIKFDDFVGCISKAKKVIRSDGIEWNFSSGNHFISLCEDNVGIYYLLIHASDNRYKFGEYGLYPREDTWYYNLIKTYSNDSRFIRFIEGDTASRFYDVYLQAEIDNVKRNNYLAEILVDSILESEYLYSPHYGMPSMSSIAIGCQWRSSPYILLSAPGKDVFVIESSEQLLLPHGFGVKAKKDCKNLQCTKQGLIINSVNYSHTEGVLFSENVCTRFEEENINQQFIINFLNNKNVKISKVLHQIYSYNRNGFLDFTK